MAGSCQITATPVLALWAEQTFRTDKPVHLPGTPACALSSALLQSKPCAINIAWGELIRSYAQPRKSRASIANHLVEPISHRVQGEA